MADALRGSHRPRRPGPWAFVRKKLRRRSRHQSDFTAGAKGDGQDRGKREELPVEGIWKFVTDPSNYRKWDKGVVETRQTSPGPLGVGTTLEAKTQEFGALSMRVVEYEPNHKFAYEFLSGPGKGSTTTFGMDSVEGGSRLTSRLA